MSKTAILSRVSLVGAGEQTDIAALQELQSDFPLIQLGISVAPEETGAHYPSVEWIGRFVKRMQRVPGTRAFHLFGSALSGFLNNDPMIWRLAPYVQNIQLNIWYNRAPVDPDVVNRVAEKLSCEHGARIVIPVNPANIPLVAGITEPSVEFLFDRSRAKREEDAAHRPEGIAGRFCLWAGRLRPDNIADEDEIIRSRAKGPYGLDMESGVSDENGQFSVAKCRQVMENLGLAR